MDEQERIKRRDYFRAYREKHKEQIKTNRINWMRSNPEKVRAWPSNSIDRRRQYIRNRYAKYGSYRTREEAIGKWRIEKGPMSQQALAMEAELHRQFHAAERAVDEGRADWYWKRPADDSTGGGAGRP